MAKLCPITGTKVVYLECQECEDKICKEVELPHCPFCGYTMIQKENTNMKNIPVYKYPVEYAAAHDELDAYRASSKANVACKKAIEEAIRDCYQNNSLDPKGAESVFNAFGQERTMYVLAITVQCSMWDGRYCPPIKDWAKTVRIFEEPHFKFGDFDVNVRYSINAHPGLIDLFAQQILKLAKKGNCGM